MSNWAYKGFGSFGYGSSSLFRRSPYPRRPFSRSKDDSAWAYSTPKRKGAYAKHWGFDPERDNVTGFERKKRRFWIW